MRVFFFVCLCVHVFSVDYAAGNICIYSLIYVNREEISQKILSNKVVIA